jgi:hypothetical protein
MNYFKEILPFIHNYWICPSNRITIQNHPDFRRGKYHDADCVMMHALFQMVVDFVEIELAANLMDGFETRWQKIVRGISDLPFIHWFIPAPRNARRGLYPLRWGMHLTDSPSQAEFSKEIFQVYKFWKHTRPRREDAHAYWHLKREGKSWRDPHTPEEDALFAVCEALQARYDAEDQDMLHTIIRIRRGMWT